MAVGILFTLICLDGVFVLFTMDGCHMAPSVNLECTAVHNHRLSLRIMYCMTVYYATKSSVGALINNKYITVDMTLCCFDCLDDIKNLERDDCSQQEINDVRWGRLLQQFYV